MNPTKECNASNGNSGPNYYNEATKTFFPSKPIRAITPSYVDKTREESTTLAEPRKLLVILDLNGTLYHRVARNNKKITPRPHLTSFLDFIFKNCRVMVWSSARAHSVEAMLGHSFGKYASHLDRIWTRDYFRLSSFDYNRKVLTIKDLEFVWDAIKKEKKEAEASGTIDEKFLLDYDQTNTVLIDDSTDKIQLQPHNGLTLLDFDEALAKSGTDSELLRVMDYLEKLVYQDNVSAYIRANPFNKGKEVDSDGSAVGNKAKENESQDTVEALTASMEKSTIS